MKRVEENTEKQKGAIRKHPPIYTRTNTELREAPVRGRKTHLVRSWLPRVESFLLEIVP